MLVQSLNNVNIQSYIPVLTEGYFNFYFSYKILLILYDIQCYKH